MAKDKIIKPGEWWIIRFRMLESYERVTGYLTCKNAFRAGHSGFDRKYTLKKMKDGTRKRRYRPRQWEVRSSSERRLAYRFAELSDARGRCKERVVGMNKPDRRGRPGRWDGAFGEIIRVEGCLHYNTISSEKVMERYFPVGMNEMEVLGVEFALGE